MILRRKSIVTVDIFYYRPDYSSLLNEFIWQTEDIIPEYPRIHQFLWHWKNNIRATISEILLCHSNDGQWRSTNFHKEL